MAGLTRLLLETESPRAEAFRDVRGPGASGWRKLLDQAETEAGDGTARTARNLAILLLLHDRALRRGEVVGIDYPEDLDASRPAVAVVGKGRLAKEWLTINEPTRDAIARYLAPRGEWPGPLFVSSDAAELAASARTPDRAGSTGRPSTGWSRRSRNGPLPGAVRADGLRHCAITTALDTGWDVCATSRRSRDTQRLIPS